MSGMTLDDYKHEGKLALDVTQTVAEMFRLIQQLHEKYPEEPKLHLHVAYNWKVAELLNKAETTPAT